MDSSPRSNWLQEEQSAPEIREFERKLGEPKLGERHEFFRKPGATPGNTGASGSTGRDRHNVRFVLGFSITAVVIVFAIIWIVYFA